MSGEPQRPFCGNQYSLTMPVFTHYGVELWVPEVGGPIDPEYCFSSEIDLWCGW